MSGSRVTIVSRLSIAWGVDDYQVRSKWDGGAPVVREHATTEIGA